MNVEFFARITCACGKAIELDAWPGEFDGIEHEEPAGWTGGYLHWKGHERVPERDFVCPECSR